MAGLLALLAIVLSARPAPASSADDPLPQRLVVRRPALWEACPTTPPATPPTRCATLVVDFEAALSSTQQAAITGPAAIAGGVWFVQSTDVTTKAATPLAVVEAKVRPQLTGFVLLVLAPSVTATAVDTTTHLITLNYLGPPNPTAISAGPQSPDDDVGALVDADDPDDPDLLFSGKVQAVDGEAPKFTVEARIRKGWFVGRNDLGGLVEIVAEEQQNADPDSITLAFSYRRVIQPLRGMVSALPISGEFSRDDPRTTGVITAADFVWNALPTQAGVVAAEVVAGLALGENLKNAISDSGSGSVQRLKLGVQAWSRWEGLFGLEQVVLSGAWTMLSLRKAEIDPERPDENEAPTLTRRARHRVTADLEFGFTSRFALAVQYRQGPLPPAFEKVSPSVAFTITYKADWR
jgi:hypothetical protein